MSLFVNSIGLGGLLLSSAITYIYTRFEVKYMIQQEQDAVISHIINLRSEAHAFYETLPIQRQMIYLPALETIDAFAAILIDFSRSQFRRRDEDNMKNAVVVVGQYKQFLRSRP